MFLVGGCAWLRARIIWEIIISHSTLPKVEPKTTLKNKVYYKEFCGRGIGVAQPVGWLALDFSPGHGLKGAGTEPHVELRRGPQSVGSLFLSFPSASPSARVLTCSKIYQSLKKEKRVLWQKRTISPFTLQSRVQ